MMKHAGVDTLVASPRTHAVLIVMSSVFAGYAVATNLRLPVPISWVSLAVLIAAAGTYRVLRSQPMDLAFGFLWALYVAFSIVPMLTLGDVAAAEYGPASRDAANAAVALAGLGLLGGHRLAVHRARPGQSPSGNAPLSVATRTARRAGRAGWAMVALGAAAALIYVAVAGLVLGDLLAFGGEQYYGAFSEDAGTSIGYFASLIGLAGAGAVWLAVAQANRAGIGVRSIAWCLPVLLLVGATGARHRVVVPALTIVLLCQRVTSPLRVMRARRTLMFASVLLLLVTAGISSVQRSPLRDTLSITESVERQLVEGLDLYLPVAAVADAQSYEEDRLGLESYVDLVALPIPRALWPDKPTGALGRLKATRLDPDAGASGPLFLEAYASFGLFGVGLFSALFGYLMRRGWNRLRAASKVTEAVLWSCTIAVALQLWTRDYLAGGLAGQFGLLVGIILGCAFVGKRQSRRPHRRSARSPGGPSHA